MECRIIQNIAVLGRNQYGIKELNLVRWFDQHDRFDLRIWTEDHKHFKGGITFSYQELYILKESLDKWFQSEDGDYG